MADAGGEIWGAICPNNGDDGNLASFEQSHDAGVDDALGVADSGVDGVVGKEVDANRRREARRQRNDQTLEEEARRGRRRKRG